MVYTVFMPRPRKNPLPTLDGSKEPIGYRLAFIRKAKGLTQVQVAEHIGIPQYLVSDYETGRLHLSDDMIIRFTKALGASSHDTGSRWPQPRSAEPSVDQEIQEDRVATCCETEGALADYRWVPEGRGDMKEDSNVHDV